MLTILRQDAQPNIGHACGHNLIAMALLGAAVTTATAMKEYGVTGKVLLVGTPAEEGGEHKSTHHHLGVRGNPELTRTTIAYCRTC